jgi:micrococcal nuclease
MSTSSARVRVRVPKLRHVLFGIFVGGVATSLLGMVALIAIAERPELAPVRNRLLSYRESLVAIDGDTVRRGKIVTRLIGFDAPETYHAQCPEEAELGLRAKQRLQELINGGAWELKVKDTQDRHGRDLAILIINGKDASEIMIAEGLARAYNGRGKRQGWCKTKP